MSDQPPVKENNPPEVNAQPVQQPVMVQPGQPGVQVQYVVQEKSLVGVGGWLIFWLIVLGIYALYGVIFTFIWISALVSGSSDANLIVATIFTPLIAASFIATIVLITLQKKLGKLLAWVSFGTVALFVTVMGIVAMVREYCTSSYSYYSYSYSSSCSHMEASGIVMVIGLIITAWVGAGLVSLYFLKSKRVALTLTK
ncbi:MAG TPA: hypothetical protein PKC31_01825 [Candidatus Nanoperiomorbaceae bacterium]|nr:MAG: hypothetical protein IPL44_03605 [Candidatus Saccharibacteria bacterium]HMQ09126.1 hypothetical protein [Candidatus Nanoperiomorbaceae bacterium]HMQ96560.1 hypothetical protein [Candidatus Nanoperiomorbaceae bacterium]HMR86182.1 hypothetical protein [Candidatus Nanoperiomorbaceae bacterium]HMU11842.1 hypothetical protein [Candidatus Nanoperiomorbaceae bacterium]